ncbi:MAG: shikimate kinase [Breznakia sp.]
MKKSNLVFIGMPCAGKTTLAKIVAKRLNKSLYDIDDMIEKKANMKIVDIFKNFGEDYFRALEIETIAHVSHFQNSVISCGGGGIKHLQNIENLKINGCIYYIQRNLQKLKIKDTSRPLVKNKESLARLYKERSTLYETCADVIIDNNKEIETAIRTILHYHNQNTHQGTGETL